jgi:predicted nuclease of predicted toxin-antitoxin system
VRFLVDECLSSTLAALLRADGHDAVHLVDLGHGGSDDAAVMRLARDQRRTVLSADTDFGELLARSNDTEPSVIPFRSNEVHSTTLAGIVRANLEQLEESLAAGAGGTSKSGCGSSPTTTPTTSPDRQAPHAIPTTPPRCQRKTVCVPFGNPAFRVIQVA